MRPLAEDEFAVRFRERDLEGWFTTEVTVREGSLDLLFLDGKLDRVLSPGKYTLSNFWQTVLRRGPKKEVVRVRSGEVALSFTLPDLLTADPLLLNLECDLVLQLQRGEEQLLYTNLMQEKERLTLLDLRALIFQPLRDTASTWFAQWTLEHLIATPSLADLALTAEEAVRQGLLGKGLRVIRVAPANPSCAAWDDKTRSLAQGLHDAWQAEGELERRKRWDEVKQATDLQAIEEETARLATFQKRADLWQRLGQAFNTAEMSRIRGEGELEEFIRQADRDKLLKADDFDRFKRTLRENQEDEAKARAHLVRAAELERDYEHKVLELRKRRDLTTTEVEFQQGLERLRLQGQQGLERQRLDFQVERERKAAESRRAAQDVEEAARRVGELEDARTQAQVQGLQREGHRPDEELQLALRERELAIQRADQAERQRLELERLQGEQERQTGRDRAQLDNRLRELDQLHQQDMQRLTQVDQMSIHALIAVSDTSKAPVLGELAELEIKKGMSYEQLLALAAEKNPQVLSYLDRAQTAKAVSEEEKRLYERIIGEQKDYTSKMGQFWRDSQEMQLRMHDKSLDTIADIARTLGRPQSVPPDRAAGASPGRPANACPHCHSALPRDAHFCPNCGGTLNRANDRVDSAIELFKQGELSLGQAAALAGYSKRAFIELLGKLGIPVVDYPEEELRRDIENA
jgi:predicted HTH domain antitoxin